MLRDLLASSSRSTACVELSAPHPRDRRAGDGNRTHVACLEGRYSTIELHLAKGGARRDGLQAGGLGLKWGTSCLGGLCSWFLMNCWRSRFRSRGLDLFPASIATDFHLDDGFCSGGWSVN